MYGESTKKTSCRVIVSVSNTMWIIYLVTASPHNRRENVPCRLAWRATTRHPGARTVCLVTVTRVQGTQRGRGGGARAPKTYVQRDYLTSRGVDDPLCDHVPQVIQRIQGREEPLQVRTSIQVAPFSRY